MKTKIGKSVLILSIISLVISLVTANVVGTIASMASVVYSTPLVTNK